MSRYEYKKTFALVLIWLTPEEIAVVERGKGQEQVHHTLKVQRTLILCIIESDNRNQDSEA